MSESTADVVVIGGGVVGVACADAITATGRRVALVDRGQFGGGTSSSCQSGIGYGMYMDEYDFGLSRAGVETYRNMAADIPEIGYVNDGAIFVGGEDEMDALWAATEDLQRRGIPSLWIERDDLEDVEPGLASWVAGGVLLEEHGQSSPPRMVAALVNRSKGRGAVLSPHTEVLAIEAPRDQVTGVMTSRGRISTACAVLAAGVWSPSIAASLGLRLPIRPQKGHVLETEPTAAAPRYFVQDVRYESVVDAAGDAAESPATTVLQHRPTGEILIGSSRDFVGFDTSVDADRSMQIAEAAYDLMPHIRNLAIQSRFAGLRPWSPDGRALIGPVPGIDGLIIATGHGGEGNTLALLTGEIVAALTAGRPSPVPINPLAPRRFLSS